MDIKIKNRSNGNVVYTIPELGDKRNVKRTFGPFEIKTIDKNELEALTFVPGGSNLLKHYLQIIEDNAPDIVEDLIGSVEQEYYMSEEDVKNLLLSNDAESDDRLRDCIDFGNQGVLDLIKDFSVSLPVNSASKRQIILEQMGFDVDRALLNKREAEKDTPTKEKKERRVTTEQPTTPERRVTSKYTITE